MEKEIYKKFYLFLEELKNVINALNSESQEKIGGIQEIDLILDELNKTKVERDCYQVQILMNKLEKVAELKELIRDSRDLADYICINK